MSPEVISTIAILSIFGIYIMVEGVKMKKTADIINFDDEDDGEEEVVIHLNLPKRTKSRRSKKTNFEKIIEDLEAQNKLDEEELRRILQGGKKTKRKRIKRSRTIKKYLRNNNRLSCKKRNENK